MRHCPKCDEDKPDEKWGTSGWCSDCRRVAESDRRRKKGIEAKKSSCIRGSEKLCRECESWKPLSHFSKSKRGRGGVAAYCKPCQAGKYRNKDKARKATSRYRAKHPERWRAMHRIHQFRRRFCKDVTSDGSVTDEVISALYSETTCYYCSKEPPTEKRTLDHKEPLSKGGTHTASNLVMACLSCNCSKQDKTEEEFKNYGIQNRTSNSEKH